MNTFKPRRVATAAIAFLITSFGLAAYAHIAPHLPLDLTSREYQQKLKSAPTNSLKAFLKPATDGLEEPLRFGERALKWADTINANRKTNKIILSSKETQKAYPIESPKIYNLDIIKTDFENYKKATPATILQVLGGDSAELPTTPPTGMDDATFAANLRRCLASYDIAARWRLLSPYLPELKMRILKDVRGYVYFSKVQDPEGTISRYNELPSAEQQDVRNAILSICYNGTRYPQQCVYQLEQAGHNPQTLLSIYRQNLNYSRNLYKSYFEIPYGVEREDIRVTKENGTTTVTIPFRDPQSAAVWNFLTENIQDEWRGDGWQLLLQKRPAPAEGSAYLYLVPGATANVEYLGGNRITMDKNVAFDDYNQSWTIRHEFGHVLGFPDCYAEFFDENLGAMVSYQIDIEDIMCSRRGHITKRHADELFRVYGSSK